MTVTKRIVKSGLFSDLLLLMDDVTFQSHLRVGRQQFNSLLCNVQRLRQQDFLIHSGFGERIPIYKELLFLWYMSNQNSFREILKILQRWNI